MSCFKFQLNILPCFITSVTVALWFQTLKGRFNTKYQYLINISSQWRHNERDAVSNHQPHDYLRNRFFRRRSKKTSKLRVTGLYKGNSPVTGEFPSQRASNAEHVSSRWRHHVSTFVNTLGVHKGAKCSHSFLLPIGPAIFADFRTNHSSDWFQTCWEQSLRNFPGTLWVFAHLSHTWLPMTDNTKLVPFVIRHVITYPCWD